MSQSTTDNTAKASAKKELLCKSFTEQGLAIYLDPIYLTLMLQAQGIAYQPKNYMDMQARMIIVNGIKEAIVEHFKAQNIDINTDEAAAKVINSIFEAVLVKTNPQAAMYSGAIPQERLQELMFGGFGGGMMGMGGMFGAQMPFGGMMGGGMPQMGAQMPFGGMNMGMPMWNQQSAKKPEAGKQQQTQQGFNPFMMGMNPMMGGMMGNPMMMGQMGMPMGFGMPFGAPGFGATGGI